MVLWRLDGHNQAPCCCHACMRESLSEFSLTDIVKKNTHISLPGFTARGVASEHRLLTQTLPAWPHDWIALLLLVEVEARPAEFRRRRFGRAASACTGIWRIAACMALKLVRCGSGSWPLPAGALLSRRVCALVTREWLTVLFKPLTMLLRGYGSLLLLQSFISCLTRAEGHVLFWLQHSCPFSLVAQ